MHARGKEQSVLSSVVVVVMDTKMSPEPLLSATNQLNLVKEKLAFVCFESVGTAHEGH